MAVSANTVSRSCYNGDAPMTRGRKRHPSGRLKPLMQSDSATFEDRMCDLLHRVGSARDRGAFSELFRHFAPRLKAYAMRGGTDAGHAEEVAQEAMVAIWRKASTFDRTRASASTWVFTIVRNKHIDMLRRERRPEVMDEDLESHVSPERPIDELFGVAQASARLHELLKTLSPEQAQVLRKSYFEHMSHSDIAQALDLPLGTVKSRIRLALGSLRTAMGESEQ